ncbi:MAG: TIGR03905 family TSCPD domain-containing protein [Bacteroidaceae bacterium]|nr:TIGR03905 family TSCPD domain-containing protein [Bacteroidaceae bacterium]
MEYITQGTCSKLISVAVDEQEVIQEVSFLGGCNGNLQGICKLVTGQKVDDVIRKLDGIRCGAKPTSCPDQLCQALKQLKSE